MSERRVLWDCPDCKIPLSVPDEPSTHECSFLKTLVEWEPHPGDTEKLQVITRLLGVCLRCGYQLTAGYTMAEAHGARLL